MCFGAVIGCTLLAGQSLKVPLVPTASYGKEMDRAWFITCVPTFFVNTPEHVGVFLLHFQAIYLLASPGGTIKLYVFVAIFGVFMMILAQLPSFHSLRHVNLISLLLCLAYSFCAVAGSIYLGTDSSSWTSTSAARRGKKSSDQ